MEKKSLNDDIFDLALKHALLELEEANVAQSVQLYEEFEDRYNQAPKRLVRHFKKLDRPRSHSRLIVSLLIAVVLMFSTVTVTSAFGFNWLKALLGENYNYSSLHTVPEEYQIHQVNMPGVYIPSYIPKGYALTEVEIYDHLYFLTFQNPSLDVIMISQRTEDTNLNFDTENASVETLAIRDMQQAYYVRKDGSQGVYGISEYGYLSIESFGQSPLQKEDLLKIMSRLEYYDIERSKQQ